MIVAGTTSYPRRLDPEPFRAIADEVGALFVFDAAHLAGLIVGGVHPDPVPFADVVTFTTHKALRGPRGAMILCKEEHAKAIDKAVFPMMQGGPLEHCIAGKAVCLKEAASDDFKDYATRVVRDARALAPAGSAGKAVLFMEWAGLHGAIPDPYTGGPDAFEHVWHLVDAAAIAAVARRTRVPGCSALTPARRLRARRRRPRRRVRAASGPARRPRRRWCARRSPCRCRRSR